MGDFIQLIVSGNGSESVTATSSVAPTITDGNMLWVRLYGGLYGDDIYDVTVDSSDHIVFGGSTTTPPRPMSDGFITRLSVT